MKKDGKKKEKNEKQIKEMKITKLDIALATLCPPAEAGVLLVKYIRNCKVTKAKEQEEQELDNYISSKKDHDDGDSEEVEIVNKEEA